MLFSDTSKNQSQIPSKNDQRSIVVMTTELSGLTAITITDAKTTVMTGHTDSTTPHNMTTETAGLTASTTTDNITDKHKDN